MSLRTKFILVLLMFTVAVCVNIFAAMWTNRIFLENATAVFQTTFRAITIIGFTRQSLDAQNALVAETFDRPQVDAETVTQIEEMSHIIRSDWSRLTRQIGTLPRLKYLQHTQAGLQDQQSALIEYMRARDAPDFLDRQAVFKKRYVETTLKLNNRLDEAERLLDQDQNVSAREAQDATGLVRMILVGMAVVEVALLLIILSFFRNWMLKPIARIRTATQQIADGHLDYRLKETGTDELAALAVQVNHMAASLSKAQKELQHKERMAAIGEMASVVAHNIRNPMAGIRATAQTTLHELPADSKLRRLQDRIVAAVDSLEQWLKELLHINRPIDLSPEATSVDDLVADLKQIFEPTSQRKNVQIRYCPYAPDVKIQVDRRYFVQALASILDNAIEASPPGVPIHITTGNDDADRHFYMEIADDGAGIPESLRERVFEPYYTTKPRGTGIGLAMARKIIESHSGRVRLVDGTSPSTAAGGTVFRIEIPSNHHAKG